MLCLLTSARFFRKVYCSIKVLQLILSLPLLKMQPDAPVSFTSSTTGEETFSRMEFRYVEINSVVN